MKRNDLHEDWESVRQAGSARGVGGGCRDCFLLLSLTESRRKQVVVCDSLFFAFLRPRYAGHPGETRARRRDDGYRAAQTFADFPDLVLSQSAALRLTRKAQVINSVLAMSLRSMVMSIPISIIALRLARNMGVISSPISALMPPTGSARRNKFFVELARLRPQTGSRIAGARNIPADFP